MENTMRFMMIMIPKGYEIAKSGAMPDADRVAMSMESPSIRRCNHRRRSRKLRPPGNALDDNFAWRLSISWPFVRRSNRGKMKRAQEAGSHSSGDQN